MSDVKEEWKDPPYSYAVVKKVADKLASRWTYTGSKSQKYGQIG